MEERGSLFGINIYIELHFYLNCLQWRYWTNEYYGAFLKQSWKMLVEITSQNSSVNSLCGYRCPICWIRLTLLLPVNDLTTGLHVSLELSLFHNLPLWPGRCALEYIPCSQPKFTVLTLSWLMKSRSLAFKLSLFYLNAIRQ